MTCIICGQNFRLSQSELSVQFRISALFHQLLILFFYPLLVLQHIIISLYPSSSHLPKFSVIFLFLSHKVQWKSLVERRLCPFICPFLRLQLFEGPNTCLAIQLKSDVCGFSCAFNHSAIHCNQEFMSGICTVASCFLYSLRLKLVFFSRPHVDPG